MASLWLAAHGDGAAGVLEVEERGVLQERRAAARSRACSTDAGPHAHACMRVRRRRCVGAAAEAQCGLACMLACLLA